MSNVFASGMNVNVSIHSPDENNASPIQITVLPPKDGAPGYTPEKGKDYFTPSDKEEIVKEVIKALPGGGGSGGGGVSSWNDLTDKPFEKDIRVKMLDAEVTLEPAEEYGGLYVTQLTYGFRVIPFERYLIVYNGEEYICKAKGDVNTLGNEAITGGEDTGEPFVIVPEEAGTLIASLHGDSTAKIVIYHITDKTIDFEFISEPPLIDLTPYQTADNGNVVFPFVSDSSVGAQFFDISEMSEGFAMKKMAKKGIVRVKLLWKKVSADSANEGTFYANTCYVDTWPSTCVFSLLAHPDFMSDGLRVDFANTKVSLRIVKY